MEKKKLVFQQKYWETLDGKFGGEEIKVAPYIPFEEMLVLASKYLENYFLSDSAETDAFLSEWNYIGAEHSLMIEVIDRFTDIMVFDENGEVVLDLNGVLSSGLWEEIKLTIENYYDVLSHIMILVDNYKNEMIMKNSFQRVLQTLINSLLDFVDRISEEGSEESLQKLTQSIEKIGETLKDSPVGAILEDANRK